MSEEINCPGCGSEIKEGTGSCETCGEKLEWRRGKPVPLTEQAEKTGSKSLTSGCLLFILLFLVLSMVLFLMPFEQ